MPVPYRPRPRLVDEGRAAYLDLLPHGGGRSFVGALLVLDGLGRPLEFVHNHLTAPTSVLWPPEAIRRVAVVNLGHSLFDACHREPDLLLCPADLAEPPVLRDELGPTVPCARIVHEGETVRFDWVNEPPGPGLRAAELADELLRRDLTEEPFARLRAGLAELYPPGWTDARSR